MHVEVFGIQIHANPAKIDHENRQKLKIAFMLLLSSFLWAWIGRWFAVDEIGEMWRYYLAVAMATSTTAYCLNRLAYMNFTRFAAGETGRRSGYKWGDDGMQHRIEYVLAARDGMSYRMLVRPFVFDPGDEIEPYWMTLHRHEIAFMVSCEESCPAILPIREGMGIWREDGMIYISILDDADKSEIRARRRRLALLARPSEREDVA